MLTNLFLNAKIIAPACSTAFPTIGSRITLVKPTDKPHEFDAACNKFNRVVINVVKIELARPTPCLWNLSRKILNISS